MTPPKSPENAPIPNLDLAALLGMAVRLCLEGRDSEAQAFLDELHAFEQTMKRFNVREDEHPQTLH